MLDPLLQPDRLGPHPCHCVVHQGYHSQGVGGSSIQTLTSVRESDFLAVGPLSHLHKWKKKGSNLHFLVTSAACHIKWRAQDSGCRFAGLPVEEQEPVPTSSLATIVTEIFSIASCF